MGQIPGGHMLIQNLYMCSQDIGHAFQSTHSLMAQASFFLLSWKENASLDCHLPHP